MLRQNNKFIRRIQLSGDLAFTALSFLIAYELRDRLLPVHLKPISEYLFLMYVVIPVWWFLLVYNGSYRSIRVKTLAQALTPVVKTVFAGGLILMAAIFIFKVPSVSRGLIGFFVAVNFIALSILKTVFFLMTHYIRKKGYNYRSVLIVGSGKRAEAFVKSVEEHKEWGIRVLGFVDQDDRPAFCSRGAIGPLSAFEEIVTANQVDEVVFVVPRSWIERIEKQVLFCERVGIKASVAADFYPHKIAKTTIEELHGWPLLAFNPYPKLEEAFVLKRVFDIAFSFFMLVLSSPFFLASIVAIKLTSPGPVFFKQVRCGMNGRRFNLLKFRTMVVEAEELKSALAHMNEVSGPVFKLKNDPRVTRAGRLLRKYSLDELPQLINVLKGDMSMVGPRPPLPEEVDRYDDWQRRRLSVRPGITCFWQINGRNNIEFDEWMRLDLEYIDNWSLGQDILIIFKTIPTVFRGTGV